MIDSKDIARGAKELQKLSFQSGYRGDNTEGVEKFYIDFIEEQERIWKNES